MYVDYVGSRTSGSRLCVLLSLRSLNTHIKNMLRYVIQRLL